MFVYLIQSARDPERRYVGLTEDVERRLKEHNEGLCASTARHRPWNLTVFVDFANPRKAEKFEAYLKHGSGHAFAKRHFW